MVSTQPSTAGYGSFSNFCSQTGITICNLFPPTPDPTCKLRRTGEIINIGNILVSCLALGILVLILIRMSRKLAAVGRREMMTLYLSLGIYLILQIFTTSGVFSTDSIHLVRLTSFQLAWSFSLFYMLLFNGLVGFQYWRDGSRLSMTLLIVISLALTSGLTVFNIRRAESFLLSSSTKSLATLNDPVLYTLYITWPIVTTSSFLIMQFVLVIRSLSARLPLAFLFLAFGFLASSQAIYFYGSSGLCKFTNHATDAAPFHAAFLLFASLTLYKFWSDITEDDWDDFKLTV